MKPLLLLPPLLLPLLLLLAASSLAAAAQDPPPPSSPPPPSPSPPFRSPADAVAARPDLSLLLAAVEATGLSAQLSSPLLPLTIFAPSNAAMLRAAESLGVSPDQMMSAQNRTLLFSVLRFHVVPGAALWSLDRLRKENPRLITLLPGAEPLEVRALANGTVLVGGGLGITSMVVEGDIYAGKSVIHVIDEVKLPGQLIEALGPPSSSSEPGAPPGAPMPPPQSNGA